ncbi:MAG TPA: ABC transporter ATP-binding protein [Hyphomicrobiales bacterium]|nr:ABC transporter ATP-binding protein [Hyphomicrobiales bacterium]
MTALRLEHLGKRFGGVEAVADLCLSAASGRITGLIGPNGAGKTTVVNIVTGILAPSSGRVLMGERDITGLKPHKIACAGAARTFQNVRLLRDATVLDNVIVGFHRHMETSLFANFVGLPSVWRERADFIRRAHAILERFGLSDLAKTRAGALSYGHQRRVEIMRALAMAPEFLLLDEPVAGMNDVEAERLGAIVRELADGGIGILLIEHNMRFVMGLCDTIYVLDSGRLIASGSPEEIGSNPAVIAAYLGE